MPDTALSADLSPAVLEWSRGLASLSPGQPPCPGFKPEDWVETLTNARRFVDDFGAEADRLGWDTLTLFSVHPKSGVIRADWCGVLMPCLYSVREVILLARAE